MLSMLNVVMLDAAMLSLVAPFQVYCLRVLPEHDGDPLWLRPQSQTLDSAGKTYQEQTLAYFPLCELRKIIIFALPIKRNLL